MMLKGNSRLTALVGGICTLRKFIHEYEQVHASIVFKDGIIIEVRRLREDGDIVEHIRELNIKYENLFIIRLDNDGEPCHIFPGLVDIHNHIDYNMMPIWKRPIQEPWDNRHEWRNCTEYLDEVKGLYQFIFNNWKKYSVQSKKEGSYNEDPYAVIQFFSELQAIAGGTTTLQEPTEISYFSDNSETQQKINRKGGHILLRSTGVSSDLGLQETQKINSVIDFFKPDTVLKAEHQKENQLQNEEVKKSFYPPIDTNDWQVIEIGANGAQKSYFQEYLDYLKYKGIGEIARNAGGYIIHLAEGRSGNVKFEVGAQKGVDAYSKKEFEYFRDKIMEIDDYKNKVAASKLTLIHCCGIDLDDEKNIRFINSCEIRLVWSPVSNLLLYDDTPRFLLSGLRTDFVCIGSDWAPSGSKHVWDEAKFAQKLAMGRFYHKPFPDNINSIFLDMITSIPASAIDANKVGEIKVGSYADFYIVSKGRKFLQQDDISEAFETFSDFDTVATIINGNLVFGIKEMFDAFGIDDDRVVSIEADMKGIDEENITDKGARNLRVYIPDIKINVDNDEKDIHIDFDAAIETLDRLFEEYNKQYNKQFVRSRLLSSYDVEYQKQIDGLLEKYGLNM
ncbi:MAG: amidohydrolase family protein [Lachnospiraceae bacterium]|nr:amidohydrolase family protein [Lachnospiraceae bacterium]